MGATLVGTTFRPSQVYYLISFRCNQRCSKCRHWDKSQDGPVLEPDLMVNALRVLAPVDEFCIVGGEPLLHAESILSILASTQHLTHRTVIVTNGVLLSPKLD